MIYRKRFRRINNSTEKAYRDSRPFEICKATLLDIMEKLESWKPVASYLEEASENSYE